jgi:hypothetical protein
MPQVSRAESVEGAMKPLTLTAEPEAEVRNCRVVDAQGTMAESKTAQRYQKHLSRIMQFKLDLEAKKDKQLQLAASVSLSPFQYCCSS